MRQMAGLFILLTIAFVGFGNVTVAQGQDKEAEIKLRRDTMKRQGNDLKAISDYAKGEADQAAAQKAADDLLALNGKIVGLFPSGTSMADFPGKTGAKPEIWQQFDKFKTIPAALKVQEQKLDDAVKSGDKAAVGAQVAATGKEGCGACHTPYREKLP
jgi:cytochrome c556